ncbi:MAG: adenylate/guanylate cyclase domain-containing protein [Nitrospiraceae bacterium]|jgi:adenylate cyclase|nr:adenylate/guanylate cyclase domain-containing protein [Nitrospiraceae bacterium]
MDPQRFRTGSFFGLVTGFSRLLTDRSRRLHASVFLGCCLAFFCAALLLLRPAYLEQIENHTLDYRFKLRGPLANPGTVVIAAIDEKSISRLGRWPWSRERLAQLVDRLHGYGAEIVVFDIILSEKEANDRRLAQSLERAGNVLLPLVFEFEKSPHPKPAGDLLMPAAFVSVANAERFEKLNPIHAENVLMPVPLLAAQAMWLGYINMIPDADGVVRWEMLAIEHDGYLYPPITLAAAAMYKGIPWDRVGIDATQAVNLGPDRVATDQWGRMLINYYGPGHSFRHIPIIDILDGTVDPKMLQRKIVLVGATAVGIYDLRVTPFDAAMAGVEKHASVITSLLEQRLLRKAPLWMDLVFLLLFGIAAALLIPRFRAVQAALVMAALLFSCGALAAFLFTGNGIVLTMIYPLLNITGTFLVITIYNYAVEERYSKQIRAMFSSYVTERVVNELIKNPDMAKLGGERREVTVLFSDVKGFTAFSERHSPEEVVSILNEYLTAMTDVIFRWEGTLDKFIGDAIVVFWGAPMPQENHVERAINCALHMHQRLGELQEKWKAEGKPVLSAGIGINTGEVLVGNIGAEGKKMDYTVIGDHVNLGARAEGLTRRYDVPIILTEYSVAKLQARMAATGGELIGHYSIRALERVIVKGKDTPVGIFALCSLEHGCASEFSSVLPEGAVKLDEK